MAKLVNYTVTFPGFIGLKGMIKIPKSIQGKKLKKFIESKTDGNLHTYSATKEGIDLITYEENYKPLVNEVPFSEYCRAHYKVNEFSAYKIYLNFENKTLVSISEGLIKAYSKCASEQELTGLAKSLEKAAYSEGLKAGFIFEKFVEVFEGDKYSLDDKKVFSEIRTEQVLRKTSYPSIQARRYFKDSLTVFNSRNMIISAVLLMFMVGNYAVYKSFNALIDNNEKTLVSLSKKIEAINVNVNRLTVDNEAEEIPVSDEEKNKEIKAIQRDLKTLKRQIIAMNSSFKKALNAPKLAGGAKEEKALLSLSPDRKEVKKTASVVRKPVLRYFMCKPLLVTDSSVMCVFKGSKFTITEKPQKVSGAYVSYIPDKQSFLTQLRGVKKLTPISIAERGFE